MCIGVPAKRGQTQNTTVGTANTRAVNCYLWSAAKPQSGSVWEGGKVKGSRKVGMSGAGGGVGGRQGELVGAQGVLSAGWLIIMSSKKWW